MLNWTCDPEAIRLEVAIAKRAVAMARVLNIEYKHLIVVMDIDACHSNGCPLRLSELLAADDGNFAHDVFGIRDNINRETGQLQNCFTPRYAMQ